MALTPFDDMNVLQKIGLVLQNTADPTTLGKYNEQLLAQEKMDMERKKLLAEQNAGPIQGTGVENQFLNIALGYQQKKAAGQPTTPQEDALYSLAQQRLERPEVITLPNGQMVQRPGYSLGAIGQSMMPQTASPTGVPPLPIQDLMPPEQGAVPGYVQETKPRQFTPASRQEKEDELADLMRGIDAVTKLQSNISLDPTSAGVVGTARSGLETAGGVLQDIGQVIPSMPGLQGLSSTVQDASKMGANRYVTEDDPLVNDLAYGLARVRQGSGKLNVDSVQNARKDVNPRGIAGSGQVLKKYQTLEEQLRNRAIQVQRELGVEQTVEPLVTQPGGVKFLGYE